MIQKKSVYEKQSPQDGCRVLAASAWPRGVPKGKAANLEWVRSLDPSPNLRDWMRRNPRKFNTFHEKYLAELARNDAGINKISALHKQYGNVTIVYVPDADGAWPVAEILTAFLAAACDVS